jgi:glycosyltransferase involved in cell wall biosynthesis
MPTVLHVLPHRGGGGERYIDLLESMDGYVQHRTWLSASRKPLTAGPSLVTRWPAVARAAGRHDLVHLHGDMASLLGLSLAQRRPAVVSTHGLSFLRRAHGLPLRLAQSRWRRVALSAQRIVCSSELERDELRALSPPQASTRLTVINNGIALPPRPTDEQRRVARTALELDQRDVACVFLGLLDRYKDPLTAIRAAELAHERGAPVKLLVAGDGPLLEDVRAHAGAAIRALGFREDPQLLLTAADVFVMPSHREGGSYALLEAMGQGLPVVASDGAGIAETVGTAGVIAPVGDTEAFADALCELASDPARRARLGSAARARVAECFEVRRFVAEVREVYEAALTSFA